MKNNLRNKLISLYINSDLFNFITTKVPGKSLNDKINSIVKNYFNNNYHNNFKNIGQKRTLEENKVIRLSFYCTSECYNSLVQLAKKQDRSLNYLIISILYFYSKSKQGGISEVE